MERSEIGAELRALRMMRGMSQLDVAEAAWVDLREVETVEGGEVRPGTGAAVARAVGARIRVVDADGFEANLGWDFRALPVQRSEGKVEEALERLTRVHHRRRRDAAVCHVEVSNHYREAVEELWGRKMQPDDTWSRMPQVGGLLLSLTPHLGDGARLVRTRTHRWWKESVVTATHIVPAGMDEEEGELYLTLRSDGVLAEEAQQLVQAL